jgi:hypothetical protein
MLKVDLLSSPSNSEGDQARPDGSGEWVHHVQHTRHIGLSEEYFFRGMHAHVRNIVPLRFEIPDGLLPLTGSAFSFQIFVFQDTYPYHNRSFSASKADGELPFSSKRIFDPTRHVSSHS